MQRLHLGTQWVGTAVRRLGLHKKVGGDTARTAGHS